MGDRENTGQQQQQGPANTRPSLPPVLALPAPDEPHPPEIQHQPDDEPQDSEPWFRNPDWYMVGLTALLFLVGVVTLVVFYDQFGEMQKQTGILNAQAQQAAADSIEAGKKVDEQLRIAAKQVRAAQESANAIQTQTVQQNRPWITAEVERKYALSFDKQGAKLRVKYSLTNIGHSVAKNIRLNYALIVQQVDWKRLGENLTCKNLAEGKEISEQGYLIFPGQAPLTGMPQLNASADKVNAGAQIGIYGGGVKPLPQVRLYIDFCVDYVGVLENKHYQTRRVYELLRPGEMKGEVPGEPGKIWAVTEGGFDPTTPVFNRFDFGATSADSAN
jgi:hypothetical protein